MISEPNFTPPEVSMPEEMMSKTSPNSFEAAGRSGDSSESAVKKILR